ncbi:MAG: hypothetical protein AB7O64_17805 [Methylibium sp.]
MSETTTTAEKQRFCKGCRDDVYNQPGNAMNGKHCWSLPDAEVVTRYRLHWWTSPVAPGAYTKVTTLSCWHSPGNWAMHKAPHPQAVDIRAESPEATA